MNYWNKYSQDTQKKAEEQLGRGEKIFREVIFPLLDLSPTWKHRGLICLPNIDSKDELRRRRFNEEEIEVNI